ncbi:betaine/proline/choline family ABC transporter ATP-binding protein [Heliorestis acidaminivorans]|uniref:ABC transporter ATP-binding protein n=1 Tax=Heliorestis acidaminivorans TaxID=553427 RepID=UPI00311A9B50
MTKRYVDGTVAVKSLNLQVAAGELVVLIGPSGCGKSTTMKMINRLVDPSSGTITVDGKDISKVNPVELRRNIGYVIQQIGLFPHMTIAQNAEIILKLKKVPENERSKKIDELLELVNLDPAQYRDRYPHELSGGQQQRVGVIRALAAEPSIILMDEPFSALDPLSREQLQDELSRLKKTIKQTIVFVTHDMDEALKIADRIILMKDGEIVQADTPDRMLRHPKNDFVREFIGEKRMVSDDSPIYVAEAMIDKPVTIDPDKGIAYCAKLMRKKLVNSLLVIDGERKLLGVLTAKKVEENYRDEDLTAGKIMNTDVPTIEDETLLSDAVTLMQEKGVGALPVINKEGRLVGLVTNSSLMDVLLKQIG